jgi:CelD/BcsL family acetyltransferase involved in cellulose biosynthesis
MGETTGMWQDYATDVIRTEEGFHSLRSEWTRLYEESSPRNPFLAYEWAEACWRNLCPGMRLFLPTARAGGRLVGVAPLRLEHHLGFRVLRFIGNGHSSYTGFLHSPEHPEAGGAMLEELSRRGRDWDLLVMHQLSSPFTRLHHGPIPKALLGQVQPVDWKGASYLARDGDWEELLDAGPGWLKQAAKRARRLEREGGTTECHTGAGALTYLDEVEYLEANSWQGRRGNTRSAAARRQVMGLLREAFETLGPRGEIELWLARVGGQAVAYAANLLLPDRLWLYRAAYHEEYARLGPGTVLDFLAIRHSWQAGRREYDYMSGNEPYKAERTDAVRPMYQLWLAPGTPRGRAAFRLNAAARSLVRQLKPAWTAMQYRLKHQKLTLPVRKPAL